MKNTTTITKKQLTALQAIFNFRFVSAKHVQCCLNQKYTKQAQRILSGLLEQNYIARHYSPRDKLNGRPAAYYLLPKAIRLLKQELNLNPEKLRISYKDSTLSSRFIHHCMLVADQFVMYTQKYGSELDFMTMRSLASHDDFPEPNPDAYIRLGAQHYLMEVFETGIPFFVLKKRAKYLISYIEDELWTESYAGDTPIVLFICEDPRQKQRLESFLSNYLQYSYINEDAMQVR